MARLVPNPELIKPAGYAHPLYAEALSEFGAPIRLPASGGQLLERVISGTAYHDAMGLYPLFCCADWHGLARDIEALRGKLVSVVVVADPFGGHDEGVLRSCFDCVVPFKTHFVVDLEQSALHGSSHHRYYARRAQREVAVEVCSEPRTKVAEWAHLYGHLIERHAIAGVQAFSLESFRRQFMVPGLVLFRAISHSGDCVGAHLWYWQGNVAYSHLSAASKQGYQCSCSYALYDAAIRFFRSRVRWLDLGGGAGTNERDDGLGVFKRGWSNATRTAFLCGRVLDPRRYDKLAAACGAGRNGYFPSYRWREAA